MVVASAKSSGIGSGGVKVLMTGTDNDETSTTELKEVRRVNEDRSKISILFSFLRSDKLAKRKCERTC